MKLALLVAAGVVLAVTLGVTRPHAMPPVVPIVLVGNFAGAGDQVAYFREGLWTISACTEPNCIGHDRIFWWGVAGDVPIVGDFDHDGLADPAVYRPWKRQLWVLRSSCNYGCYSLVEDQ